MGGGVLGPARPRKPSQCVSCSSSAASKKCCRGRPPHKSCLRRARRPTAVPSPVPPSAVSRGRSKCDSRRIFAPHASRWAPPALPTTPIASPRACTNAAGSTPCNLMDRARCSGEDWPGAAPVSLCLRPASFALGDAHHKSRAPCSVSSMSSKPLAAAFATLINMRLLGSCNKTNWFPSDREGWRPKPPTYKTISVIPVQNAIFSIPQYRTWVHVCVTPIGPARGRSPAVWQACQCSAGHPLEHMFTRDILDATPPRYGPPAQNTSGKGAEFHMQKSHVNIHGRI